MESLKIALASDWYYPKVGGIETHIHELAYNLLKLGHEPHVFTHDYRHYKWNRIEKVPYPVYRLRGLVYIKRAHISLGPGSLIEANRIYKKVGFDVTHVHSIYSPLGLALANLSRGIRGVPVVATNHSFFSWHSRAARLSLPLLRRSLCRVDSFIAVSRAVAEDTRKVLGRSLRGRMIYVIPNAIDVSMWRPPEPEEAEEARRSLGIGSGERVVTVIGRFTERKAVHTAPRIVRAAAEKAGRKVMLLIIGDGPLRERVLEEAARYNGGPLRVIVKGFMSRSELRRVYWASDLLFATSKMEAFSITALEAMASAVPVVGYRGCGLEDVAGNDSGVLVANEDEAVESIAGLLADDEARARLAAKAVERAQKKFSWSAILPRIIQVYREAMDLAVLEDKRYLLYRLWRWIKG